MANQGLPEWMGKMRALTNDEIVEFLSGPIVARVALTKPDGAPYVAPVWQEYDGEALYFIPRATSKFAPWLVADARLCISCALSSAPYTRVLFEGTGEIVSGPAPMEGQCLEIARRMANRYLGEHGPRYIEPSIPRPRYLVKLVPDKITSWEGVEWAKQYLKEAEQEYNYRVTSDESKSCANCANKSDGFCTVLQIDVDETFICDAHQEEAF